MSDVSVVMCTYNGARFVREQLGSILAQSEPPLEVIVSDDGSTDETLAIVEDVAADSVVPVKVFRQVDNVGFSENFLAACDHATGDYIAFSDQDDRWQTAKLAVSRAALREHQAVLAVHAVEHIDQQNHPLGVNNQGITHTRTIGALQADPWGVYYGFTMLFERALLHRLPRAARGQDSFSVGRELSHDRWVYFLASCFGRIVTLGDVLADYRQHDSQLYGGDELSLVDRLRERSTDRGSRVRYLAEVAAHRVAVLTAAAPGARDRSYALAADRWRRVERFCRRSSDAQSAASFARSVALLAANVREGAYAPVSAGGLGRRQLLIDLSSTSIGRGGITLLSRLLSGRRTSVDA